MKNCFRQSSARNLVFGLLVLIGGCASLPTEVERPPSYALRDTATTLLGRAMRAQVEAHAGQSGVYLLPNGLDAFVARAVLAKLADRSIDAQYYLLHDDLVGRLFLATLLQAADRGVRVRLLVDDMALDPKKDARAAALDAHPNIEVRVFNPFNRGRSRLFQYFIRYGEITRRMHNKSFTVDNQLTVLGGRNIGNEYFQADPELEFGDLDVLAAGRVVGQVSSSFDLYWNHNASYPIRALIKRPPTVEEVGQARRGFLDYVAQQRESEYLRALTNSRLAEQLADQSFSLDWGEVYPVYDHPDKVVSYRDRKDLRLTTQLARHTANIERELTIISPYFVPGAAGVDYLRLLREQGVRVRILTNSLASTDVSIVHAAYSKYRKSLLQAGIEIYEVDKTLTRKQRREKKGPIGSQKASLHAKSFVIDRTQVFVGSLNLDPRSVVENTEIGLLIESDRAALQISRWFDQIAHNGAFRVALEIDEKGKEQFVWHRIEDGEAKVYFHEPRSSFWRRLSMPFLRLFAIETQL